jgi:malonyl CoA-acyl carrier protein transacylase
MGAEDADDARPAWPTLRRTKQGSRLFAADRPTVEKVLAEVEGYVVCANVNSPTQTIISGRTRAVEAAVAALSLVLDAVGFP